MESQDPHPLWLPLLLSSSSVSLPPFTRVLRMEMKHFLCFSQCSTGKCGWLFIRQFRSGESTVHRLCCRLCRGQASSTHNQPHRVTVKKHSTGQEAAAWGLRVSGKELHLTSHHYYFSKRSLLRMQLMGMRAWNADAFLTDNRWQ